MQVLLVKRTLFLSNNSQTITPPAQLQQLVKLMPTKLFQRGGAVGGAQGSTHTSLGNVLTCQKESPRIHRGLFCNAPLEWEICIYGKKATFTVQTFQPKRTTSMLFHSQKHFRFSIHKSSSIIPNVMIPFQPGQNSQTQILHGILNRHCSPKNQLDCHRVYTE